MGKIGPRKGSLAFWHRKRAAKMIPRIRSWNQDGKQGLLGTLGYKVGMTHVLMVDDSESPFKGQEVSRAATVVEVPPIFVYSIVAYSTTEYGLKAVAEVVTDVLPKELAAFSTHTVSKQKHDLNSIAKLLQEKKLEEVRIIAVSQPWKTKNGEKRPDFFEIALAGNVDQQFAAAKSVFAKEVPVSSILEEGEYVDIVAVTKGKGWQGVVKRFGVALNPMKATQARRKGGSLGAETPARIFYSVPRAGQMGFHRRTDANKRILKIGANAKDVAPKGGFLHYGNVASEFILIDGSIPGPAKRPVRLRRSIRGLKTKKPEIKFIDLSAKN